MPFNIRLLSLHNKVFIVFIKYCLIPKNYYFLLLLISLKYKQFNDYTVHTFVKKNLLFDLKL